MKRISILGSTGSIGIQALEVVAHFPDQFEVVALAAATNIDLLEEQVRRFKPQCVAVLSLEKAHALQKRGIAVEAGPAGIIAAATYPATDLVIAAISGTLGIEPTIAAIAAKKDVALATKEVLVSAGHLAMQLAAQNDVSLLPLDSEHSALFQCLQGATMADVSRLILTCSGGPFYRYSKEQLQAVTLEQALNHPKWKMGKKISIDSSTLMNKGLEVIEAHWLFGTPLDKIEVVIHPESIIHSFVEFKDGSILAQMADPSMILPIQYAMTYPQRKPSFLKPFDFQKAFQLNFSPPDKALFPALNLAYHAMQSGPSYPPYMNAANEVLVHRFLQKEISWQQISQKLEQLLAQHKPTAVSTVSEVLALDHLARQQAKKV